MPKPPLDALAQKRVEQQVRLGKICYRQRRVVKCAIGHLSLNNSKVVMLAEEPLHQAEKKEH